MPLASGAAGRPIDPVPVIVTYVYGDATPIDSCFFTAARAYRVNSIIVRPRVVGSDGGAVTAEIRKAASTVAPASGTLLHTGTADLKGTVEVNQVLGLSATTAALDMAAGDSLCFDTTGTMTAARGCVTVELIPLA